MTKEHISVYQVDGEAEKFLCSLTIADHADELMKAVEDWRGAQPDETGYDKLRATLPKRRRVLRKPKNKRTEG